MRGVIFFALGSLLLVVLIEGCSNGKGKGVPQGAEVQGNTIFLSEEMAKNITVVNPIIKDHIEKLKLLGKVSFDPDYTTQVYSLVNGSISKIFVTQGSIVKKGDVLAEIHSGDYASAISDYEKALSNLNISEKNLSRVKDLYAQKILSDKEMQLAENGYQSAKADYEKALKTLSILG
ncbi:MAG: efflux RND transporter periplasmic adaptor subunit, partial [Candidatus Kryptoniota bacterium]